MNPSDNKPATYRAKQTTAGNWDAWGTRELVVAAGTTAGVVEPTLTARGDLSFVAVTKNARALRRTCTTPTHGSSRTANPASRGRDALRAARKSIVDCLLFVSGGSADGCGLEFLRDLDDGRLADRTKRRL